MTSISENIKAQDQASKVNFENLASILQENTNDKSLKIIDYFATSFIPIGENFGSIMIKLDVTIETNGKIEKLHLVAKTIHPSDNPIISWPLAVKKEVFIFEKLIPAYRNLER